MDAAKYSGGEALYLSRGYDLIYGVHGHGFYGFPLPWGEDEAMDYYLKWNGH